MTFSTLCWNTAKKNKKKTRKEKLWHPYFKLRDGRMDKRTTYGRMDKQTVIKIPVCPSIFAWNTSLMAIWALTYRLQHLIACLIQIGRWCLKIQNGCQRAKKLPLTVNRPDNTVRTTTAGMLYARVNRWHC